MNSIPKQIEDHIDFITHHIPGFHLWKDLQSTYITGSLNTAKLFGFRNTNELSGITDYDIQCDAVLDADLYIHHDKKVIETISSIRVLDVHTYADDKIRTLLINKFPLKYNDQVIGIGCHCQEISNTLIYQFSQLLSKTNPVKKQTTHYYLDHDYLGFNLSKRQSQCLFYLIRGKTNKDISKILNLSIRTIESHLEEIKNKMNCSRKGEVIEKAIALGFADIIPFNIENRCQASSFY